MDIHEAILNSDWKSFKELLTPQRLNQRKNDGQTPLITTICSRCDYIQEEMAYTLIKEGADLNLQDHVDYNALMYSFEINRFELSQKLITEENIFQKNEDGTYPLTLAIFHGKKQLIDLVLNYGNNVSDLEKMKNHIIFPQHELSEYALQKIDNKILFLNLNDKLKTSQNEIKKMKI